MFQAWSPLELEEAPTTVMHSPPARSMFNVTSQEMRNSDHQWDYENVPAVKDWKGWESPWFL